MIDNLKTESLMPLAYIIKKLYVPLQCNDLDPQFQVITCLNISSEGHGFGSYMQTTLKDPTITQVSGLYKCYSTW